jgi:two-component system, OmpR family, response regulator MprA
MKVTDPGTRTLSILVVDDYPDAAANLALVLALEGFAARTALSGAAALSAAAAEPPDVLILEPRTVGCGWEITHRIADLVANRWPLLVVFTTDTTLAGRLATHAARIGIYLVKPGDPALLVGVLRDFERVMGPEMAPAIRPACGRTMETARRTATMSSWLSAPLGVTCQEF